MRHKRLIAATAILSSLCCTGAFAADPFTITSSSFKGDGPIAVKYGGNVSKIPSCVGENISPAFQWSNVPAAAKSLALMMTDPEGRGGLGVVHWIAYGIPANSSGLAEGDAAKPTGKFTPGKNIEGALGYVGPCPPPGNPHHYIFTLVATDLEPDALPPGLTQTELLAKLDGHAKGGTVVVGLYKHP